MPLGYFSGIGLRMRVSTAHSAVTQATWGATCRPPTVPVNERMWAS